MIFNLFSLGTLYLLLLILFLYLYFTEKKYVGLQAIHLFSFICVIGLFIWLIYIQTAYDLGLSSNMENFVLDDMDLNNLVQNGQETYTASTTFFVYNFEDIERFKEDLINDAHFCFYYNNSDDQANVVRVVNGVEFISDYLYLRNNTVGQECLHINTSYIKQNGLLGLNCLDCAVGNPLNIQKYDVTGLVDEIHITKDNPTTYSFETELTAHGFWIETRSFPYDRVQENVRIFIWFASIILFAHLMRIVIKLIGITKDELL